MHQPRLVFDVTGLVLRAGSRPTGIERVMLEIALALIADDRHSVQFCSYDAPDKIYRQIDSATVKELAGRMRGRNETVPPTVQDERQSPARPKLVDVRLRPTVTHAQQAARHALRSAIEIGRSLIAAQTDVARAWSNRHRERASRDRCFSRHWDSLTTYCSIDAAFSDHDLEILTQRREEMGFRVALMVHDLIPVVAPQYFPLNFDELFRQVLRVADVVVVNSDATQDDVTAFARRHCMKMPDFVKLPMASALRDLPSEMPGPLPGGIMIPDGGYVLCVGTVTTRKNHRLLLDVWEQLIAMEGAENTPMLIVVGARGWLADETMSRLEQTPAFRGVVHHLAGEPDEHLSWLYEHCAFTVYPSLYEGWGLPVTESHDFGKVCLSSDRSSLPEAGEGLSELLDPTDRTMWIEHVRRYWTDADLRSRREARISNEHRRTTAEDAATSILRVGGIVA